MVLNSLTLEEGLSGLALEERLSGLTLEELFARTFSQGAGEVAKLLVPEQDGGLSAPSKG